jgi:hypothetical protein
VRRKPTESAPAEGKPESARPASSTGRNIRIGFVTLIIVVAPVYYTLIATGRPLLARMVNNDTGLGTSYWAGLTNPKNLDVHIRFHVLPAFQVYVNQVDNTLFYGDDNAFILPALVPIFLLGLFYAVWRWRAPGTLLVLMWLVSTSFGNSLMVGSVDSPRYVTVFPALALVCALGIRYTIPLLIRHANRARILIVVAGIAFAFVQINYYFNEHLPAYNRVFRVNNARPDGYDAALRSVSFPAGTSIHLISENRFGQIEANGLMGFMRDNLYLDTLKPEEFTDQYISDLRCRVDHAFFIERTDFKTLEKLRANFFLRDPQVTPHDDILPSQRFILFYAPYIKGSEKVYGRKC